MHELDYKTLLENVNVMINLLEFDGMRSPGKAKMNSQHLHSLYFLKERYDDIIAKSVKKDVKE